MLISALVTASIPAWGAGEVQITEVGLKGYYSTGVPTSVAVQVKAPADTRAIHLDFTASLDVRDRFGPSRVDHFSQLLPVKPGEENATIVPMILAPSGSWSSTLEVVATDSAGRHIGSSSVNLDSLSRLSTERLIAIICKERSACDNAQSQISFSGSEDDVSSKNQNLKFVTLQTPRNSYLDYSPAKIIVVAGPVGDWTADQRFALEAFVRAGGTVILLESEIADKSFFAAYRTGAANVPAQVGRGRLYRIASLQSKDLGGWFSGKNWKMSNAPAGMPEGSGLDALRRSLALNFTFPRLRWFLIWMSIYILVVGLGNFALLRRFRRMEWGWVTTTAIAILFAVGLYFVSSRNRPKQVTLDNITVYWMDTKSPVALTTVGLRVSSPERQELRVSVGDGAVLTSPGPTETGATADIAGEVTRDDQIRPGWDMNSGPPVQVELSLLRWSYSDLDFQTFHTFAGTVTMTAPLRIKNETGQQFRQAIYLDFVENKKYVISGLAPGQEIDLNALSSTPIWIKVRGTSGQYTFEANRPYPSNSPLMQDGVLNLANLPYTAFSFGNVGHVFVGASDGPVPAADIPDVRFVQNHFALTIVGMDQP